MCSRDAPQWLPLPVHRTNTGDLCGGREKGEPWDGGPCGIRKKQKGVNLLKCGLSYLQGCRVKGLQGLPGLRRVGLWLLGDQLQGKRQPKGKGRG